MRIILAALLILIFALTAFADQAAYITEKQAKKAVKLLKNKKLIKHYCKPCDDQSKRSEEIVTIEAVPTGYEDYWEVRVNGAGIDLAYVYYHKKKHVWRNAAIKLGIPVSGVPEFLTDTGK